MAFGQNVLFRSKKPIATQSYWNIVDLLAQAISLACSSRLDRPAEVSRITNLAVSGKKSSGWNNGTGREGKIKYEDLKERLKQLLKTDDQTVDDEQKTAGTPPDQNLATWYDRTVAEKSMTARKKQRQLLEHLYRSAEDDDANMAFSQDERLGISSEERLAIETMFVHTAVSKPRDQQGKELLEGGSYFRSGSHGIKQALADKAKIDQDDFWGKTVRPFNQAMFELLEKEKILKGKLAETEFMDVYGHHHAGIAAYGYEKFSKVSGLGLISNAIRTARILSSLWAQNLDDESDEDDEDYDPDDEALDSEGDFDEGLFDEDSDSEPPFDDQVGTPEADMDELDDVPGFEDHQRLGHIVDPSLLSPSAYDGKKTNYHDHMLQNRGAVIHEVGEWVNANFTGIRAVQSPEHPSLILELIGDTNIKQGKYTWMNLFIQYFNRNAPNAARQIRLTHRNSFGFLYPTAAELGGPVRVWPGAVPSSVLKRMLKSTIEALADESPLALQVGKNQETFSDSPIRPRSKTNTNSGPSVADLDSSEAAADDFPLHLETLRSAVLFAHLTLQRGTKLSANPTLYQWVLLRLERNLQKAQFLLEHATSPKTVDWEHHFLKSGSVIENLMEYSYMLLAVTEETAPESAPLEEPYLEHIQKSLNKTSEDQGTRLFHLDSGMQALTLAGLIARKYLEKTGRLHSKATMTLAKPYFEVPGVNKFKLNLKEVGADKNPDLIVTDLNPVLTSSKDQAAYSHQNLEKILAQNTQPSNKKPIPIIDITNSNLAKAGDLMSRYPYPNYMVAESLSKHEHLGTDKFNAGRLIVVGDSALLKIAQDLAGPVEQDAGDPMVNQYRRQIDQVFYGSSNQVSQDYAQRFVQRAPRYTQFMTLMGLGGEWQSLLDESRLDEDAEDRSVQARTLYKQLRQLLLSGFDRYKGEVRKSGTSDFPLEKAFQSLPKSDQNSLQMTLSAAIDGFSSGDSYESQIAAQGLELLGNTGIHNLGQTCYLAATLNTLAFSGYYALFTPRNQDPLAALRADVKQILDKIRAGTLVQRDDIQQLLLQLNHYQLLESPNHFGPRTHLLGQRDPAEVLEYMLEFFGQGQEERFKLSQTYGTRLQHPQQDEGDPDRYSTLDDQNRLPTETRTHWMLRLPITQVQNLAGAMTWYLRNENVPDVKARQNGQVVKSHAIRSTQLGDETPTTVTIQLVRWSITGAKESKPVSMPREFAFNGYQYRLSSVIYHQGRSARQGHYTTSTADGNNWRFRDDTAVYSDTNIVERSQLGYLYTYDQVGELEEDHGLMTLDNPLAVQGGPQADLGMLGHSGRNGLGSTGTSRSVTRSGTVSNVSSQTLTAFLVQQNPIVELELGGNRIQADFGILFRTLGHRAFRNPRTFYRSARHLMKRNWTEAFGEQDDDLETQFGPTKKRKRLFVRIRFRRPVNLLSLTSQGFFGAGSLVPSNVIATQNTFTFFIDLDDSDDDSGNSGGAPMD